MTITRLPRPKLPIRGLQVGFRQFTVDEYHEMIRRRILTDDDRLELIDGYLVLKMSRNPLHDSTLQKLNKRLPRLLPTGWDTRIQSAITLTDSEPEPDVAIVRGDETTYTDHHPGPAEIGIVVEVADSTLESDRDDKAKIYARSSIACYWIVNLQDRRVEVYTRPSGPTNDPAYLQSDVISPGDSIPVVLDGVAVATIPVDDLVP